MSPTSEYQRIRATKAGSCLTITLHYPERRNAIGPVMTSEILGALDEGVEDDGVKVIVLTGEGKAFCAGGDFGQMAPTEGGERAELRGDYVDLLLALWRSTKPVIAKVNGHAMGGGLGLVAASTFAIASDAALLGTPEVEVGLFPMMIMAVLSRLMTRRRLVEMMLLGQKLSATEALHAGLVGKVVPAEGLDAAVDELVTGLASKSSSTLRLGLKALADHEDLALEKALPMLRERLAECLSTDDAREGLTAFLEKRTPHWKGR